MLGSVISGHSGNVRYNLKASMSGGELVSFGIRFFSKLAATYMVKKKKKSKMKLNKMNNAGAQTQTSKD